MPTLTRSKSNAPVLVQTTDLTAGLDRRVSPTQMKPDRARRLRNVNLSIPGEWQPRAGWETWLTASLGSGAPQGGQRVYLDGVSPFTLLAWNGAVYKPSDSGVSGSTVLTGLNSSAAVYFPHDAELVAAFDGVNVPKKSNNGTTWTPMGITPPAAPSVSAGAGGSLIDAHVYEVSASYAQTSGASHPIAESNESAVNTQAVSGGDLSVVVALLNSADGQVDTINVYARDVTAGESVRRFAGTRANSNGTVTITDNTWSAEVEAPTRKDVPPALVYGVPWKNRWWAIDAADRTLLRFTEIFENQSWPTLYYIRIPFTRGDEIAAVIALGDVLVVFGKAKQAFLIIGQTSLDFEVRPSASIEAGALGFRAVDLVEDGIIHAAAQGVYVFDGASDRLLSYDLELDWRQMVAVSTPAALSRVPVVYHRRDKELRIGVPLLPVYGTAGEWVLNLSRTNVKNIPAWSTTDRALGGYVQWDGDESTTGNQGRLFSWSNTIGRVAEESVGTSADGSDLIVDYEGPAFTSDLRVSRFLTLYLEIEPNDGAFSLEIRCDGLTVLHPSITISGGISVYGEAEYGIDSYGGAARTMIPIDLPLEAEGRTIQIRGEYQGQSAFKWFSYGIAILPEPELRGF